MRLWIIGSKGLLGRCLISMAPSFCIGSSKEEADVSCIESLRRFAKDKKITHIVNCSAFSHVDAAEKEREKAFQVNAIGPENIASIAGEIGAFALHVSTDYVFPGSGALPLSEEDLTSPLNYYGATKLEGELRFLAKMPSGCILRTSSLFGSGGTNFIARMFSVLSEKKEILLTDDQVNSPTFAPDLSRAILEMLEEPGVFHFSNQGGASKFAFVSAMRSFLPKRQIQASLVAVPASAFPECCLRPKYSVFNTAKIASKLSFAIPSWQEALERFVCK